MSLRAAELAGAIDNQDGECRLTTWRTAITTTQPASLAGSEAGTSCAAFVAIGRRIARRKSKRASRACGTKKRPNNTATSHRRARRRPLREAPKTGRDTLVVPTRGINYGGQCRDLSSLMKGRPSELPPSKPLSSVDRVADQSRSKALCGLRRCDNASYANSEAWKDGFGRR